MRLRLTCAWTGLNGKIKSQLNLQTGPINRLPTYTFLLTAYRPERCVAPWFLPPTNLWNVVPRGPVPVSSHVDAVVRVCECRSSRLSFMLPFESDDPHVYSSSLARWLLWGCAGWTEQIRTLPSAFESLRPSCRCGRIILTSEVTVQKLRRQRKIEDAFGCDAHLPSTRYCGGHNVYAGNWDSVERHSAEGGVWWRRRPLLRRVRDHREETRPGFFLRAREGVWEQTSRSGNLPFVFLCT